MTRTANHLRGESSPYLLQHANNPVEWYPWGEPAFSLARERDRPIFLSIGYAACHWCHVMERESFENDAIAELLNAHFVSIKVDREERPDVDEIYMHAVQMMTGQGGWPLSVFLTPDLRPFFGGTYFPPETRWGRIGFGELLERIRDAWSTRREDLLSSADELVRAIRRVADVDSGAGDPGTDVAGPELRERAVAELASRFDARHGGFGGAPKFPPDQALALLLAEHARSDRPEPLRMASSTLAAMASGGLYDHFGGGFSRYSVDERWLVPHFEKMLYNQALLVPVYADAWLLTERPAFRRAVAGTTAFVRRELTHPEGGLYASLDADSEGVEGKYYVWTPEEIHDVLGPADGARICRLFDVHEGGNFASRSIPNLLSADPSAIARDEGRPQAEVELEIDRLVARLREARERRVRPATDDKILTSWNGLMITAFCRAAQVFGDEADLAAARAAASFVLDRLWIDGRLRVSWRDGRARFNGYLDDYAFLGRGLVDLYETTFERLWLDAAEALGRTLVERFEDRERGGFYFVSDDHEELLVRTRPTHDGALPSGAALAVQLLARLARHLADDGFRRSARRALASLRPSLERMPSAHAATLLAARWEDGSAREVAFGGDPALPACAEMIERARRRVDPPVVVSAGRSAADAALPLLAGRSPGSGPALAYVCREGACASPVGDADALDHRLREG